MAGGHHGVSHPQTLDIGEQNLRPALYKLIGPEQAPALQQPGDLSGFASRRGAQVQHPLSRLRVQHRDGGAGRGLLHIEQSSVMSRELSHPFLPCLEGEAERGKGRWLDGERQALPQQLFPALQGIAAQAANSGAAAAFQKGRIFLPQKRLHSL